MRPALFPFGFLSLRLLAALLVLAATAGTGWGQTAPIRLRVIGGLADVSQYTEHEVPFWSTRVPQLTAGVVHAEIAPFDRSGIRGQDMLRLMRLGVVSFGNVLLSLASAEDPELDALNLPLLNRDLVSMRRSAAAWRPHLAEMLRDRYNLELLGIFTYPAQVVLCRGAFTGLEDLVGRRVRTSSVAQAELMTAVGAVPVVIPFAEIVPAMRDGVVNCAITGALSASSIGMQTVATHVSPLPINWGISVFAANRNAWQALPDTIRRRLRDALGDLQEEIWQAAERADVEGVACMTGRQPCPTGPQGQLRQVQDTTPEAARRGLLARVVVPGWVRRCGIGCVRSWNATLAPLAGLTAEAD